MKTVYNMQSKAISVEQYLKELPVERQEAIIKLRKIIKKKLPKGFKETLNYDMISYTVPHSIYPKGYHCNPAMPLPFMSIASQKNFITVYHMGIYCDKKLLDWFTKEYHKQAVGKPDMGKSCIRFKKQENIPFNLLGDLAEKITVQQWIDKYEKMLSSSKSYTKK